MNLDTDISTPDLIEILAGPARGTLELLVAQGTPFTNQIVFEDDGTINLALYDGGYDEFVVALTHILSNHSPRWIAHIADTWHLAMDRKHPTPSQIEAFNRRNEGTNLGVLFEEGHPDVSEALSVMVARRNPLHPMGVEVAPYLLPYEREYDGEVTWGEPVGEGTDTTGRVGDTLRRAVYAATPGAMFS